LNIGRDEQPQVLVPLLFDFMLIVVVPLERLLERLIVTDSCTIPSA
jgi:hypothetical protein